MKKAFTLIELLIVVAIIAILAAIAVPNFLEAQVRSKVSRCYADLRTVGLALESYSIDWNGNYPHDQELTQAITGNQNMEWQRRYAYRMLTTPVAYLSGYLWDAFQVGRKPQEESTDRNVYAYRNIRWLGGKKHTAAGNVWNQCFKKGYMWTTKSNGPMLLWSGNMAEAILIAGQNDVYDATNGTVSKGIILYTNKGIFKNKE